MSLTPTPVCLQKPRTMFAFLGTNTPVNTVVTIVTAGPNGNKIVAITAALNSASAKVMQVWDSQGGVASLLTAYSIPANSGVDGSTPVANILGLWAGLPRDNDGQIYFFCEPGHTLGVSLIATLTAGGQCWATCVNAEF